MSDQTSTTPPQNNPPQPRRTSLLKWYAEKKIARDLLCVMATANQWDAHQIEGSLEETILTEIEFEQALAEARKIVEDAKNSATRAAAGRRSARPRVISHEKFLLAMVVTKPTKTHIDAISVQLSDDSITPQMQGDVMIGFLDEHTIWPPIGSAAKAHIIDEYPVAYSRAFPQLLMMLAGGDADSVKKVG